MAHRFSLLRPGALIALVAVALVFLAQGDTAEASFNPQAVLELTDSTPGATSDIKTEFNLPEGDVNFSGNVNFIPNEWGVALDADVPDGAILAQLNAQATLGLLGSHCGNVLPVGFTMFEGTTDTSNTINPKPVGKSDQLRPLMEDNDGNGILDAADRYPSYLLAEFDPDWVDAGPDGISGTSDDNDGPLPPVKPIARQVGATEPPGTGLAVILNFLLFEPGTVLPDIDPFPASLGYPSVTVLQDTTVATSPGVISDFCSPLLTNATNNGVTADNPNTATNEGGIAYRTNPATDGFYRFIGLSRGLRDADGDGHENQLDTCPFASTPNWDPRVSGGGGLDPDQDGLPDACDPDPGVKSVPSSQFLDCESGNTGPDYDQDCYSDRQDNCPLVENGIDGFGNLIGSNNQEDTDSDGIGDVCDTEGNGPTVPDGERPLVCTVLPVTIGSPSGSAPAFDCEAALAGGTGEEQEQQEQQVEEQLLAALSPGLNLSATSSSAIPGGSIVVLAAFADKDGKALANVDVTCKIEQQPGTDADLDGKTEVTITADAQGLAKTTLHAGTKVGSVVVACTAEDPATGQTQTKTITVSVVEAGPATGVGALAPAISSIPAWGAIASALGGAGILGAISSFALRTFRRRRD